MNQRIQELAEQAGFNISNDPIDGQDFNYEIEKFAELIVKECVGLLGPAHSVMTDPIKEHFGVEE
jgi:hypothetical protein